VGEAAADVFHRSGEVFGGDEEMDVVGHDDEGVEFVEAFSAVVLEGFEEEFGGRVDLEEAAAVGGDRGDEEGSCGGRSQRACHAGIVAGS